MVSISLSFVCAIYEHLEQPEWMSVPALGGMQKVVCRATNRVFVGLQLCEHSPGLPSLVLISTVLGRDSDWMDLNIQYSVDVIKGAAISRLLPDFLKP